MIKKFFLCPTNTPAVEFSTLPVQLSFPQANSVSVSTPDLSPLNANLCQSNSTAMADERIHQYPSISSEDNNLEEPLSQLRLQSQIEARSSFAFNPQLSINGTNAEPVDLVANMSIMSLHLGNQEQAGSVLALKGSIFYDNLLSSN